MPAQILQFTLHVGDGPLVGHGIVICILWFAYFGLFSGSGKSLTDSQELRYTPVIFYSSTIRPITTYLASS